MGNKMQANYNAVLQHGGSLKESVDILRKSIKDLYELDDDNYRLIKGLRNELDEFKKKSARTEKNLRRSCKLAGFGLLVLSFGCIVQNKIVEKHERTINAMKQKIEDMDQRITVDEIVEGKQESDG